jgi:hypothetical protein
MDIQIKHNTQEQVFYAEIDGKESEAELAYSKPKDTILDFTHTYVPDELRNMKIGEQLVTTGLVFAKENGLKVIGTCRFVASYLKRHPEYDNLLAKADD